jgi:hypothetical protein
MEYVIEALDSDIFTGILDLPVSLRHKKVAVTVKSLEFEASQTADDSAYGIFHKYADPSKIAGEKGAWERSVVEKYANS